MSKPAKTRHELVATAVLVGTSEADILSGYGSDDTITGLGGNDEIYGGLGNDRINGNVGHDYLSGGHGNDRIFGGAGRDRLYGEEGDDRLDGGLGDDSLNGGFGNDSYVFRPGFGDDRIYDTDGNDRILLDAAITMSDVTLSQYADGLLLKINGTADAVWVEGHFHYGIAAIEAIEFADGTVWDAETIFKMTFKPTEGDDDFAGSHGDDYLYGLGGNDTLSGNRGNDLFDGGAGDDFLEDAGGDDTYLFGFGSGSDSILDRYRYDADRILLGTGITTSDVTLKREAWDLTLTLNATGEKVRVVDHFSSDIDSDYFESIGTIEFADGTIWGLADILANIRPTKTSDYLMGTAGDDTIHGLGGNDEIVGYGGNDKLFGDLGNDELYGGSGNDRLVGGVGEDRHEGGTGNDRYVFNESVVGDTVYDTGGADRIVFGSWISAADVTLSREDRTTLILTFDTTGERLRIDQHFNGCEIEAVEFSDGTVWNSTTAPDWF